MREYLIVAVSPIRSFLMMENPFREPSDAETIVRLIVFFYFSARLVCFLFAAASIPLLFRSLDRKHVVSTLCMNIICKYAHVRRCVFSRLRLNLPQIRKNTYYFLFVSLSSHARVKLVKPNEPSKRNATLHVVIGRKILVVDNRRAISKQMPQKKKRNT